jgi:hypothetical protein
MGKFTDDVPLRPKGSVQPPSVHLLLRKLDVQDAPIEAQTSALRKWLINNEPGPTLERSMRRNGFGPVLDARASA